MIGNDVINEAPRRVRDKIYCNELLKLGAVKPRIYEQMDFDFSNRSKFKIVFVDPIGEIDDITFSDIEDLRERIKSLKLKYLLLQNN